MEDWVQHFDKEVTTTLMLRSAPSFGVCPVPLDSLLVAFKYGSTDMQHGTELPELGEKGRMTTNDG